MAEISPIVNTPRGMMSTAAAAQAGYSSSQISSFSPATQAQMVPAVRSATSPTSSGGSVNPAYSTSVSRIGGGTTTSSYAGTGQYVTGQASGSTFGTTTTGVRDTSLESANLAKMISSGQLPAGSTLSNQLTQEKVNLFTYGVAAPIWGATDSSLAATQQTQNQLNNVNTQLSQTNQQLMAYSAPTLPSYKYYTDFTNEIQKQRDTLKSDYDKQAADINTQYDQASRLNLGAARSMLATTGALQTGASGISYMQKASLDLLNQKQAVLNQALAAYHSADYNMFQAKIAESHAITNQYNQVQSQMFADQLASNNEQRTQAEFGWSFQDHIMKQLSEIAASGVDYATMNPAQQAQVATMEQQAGIPAGTAQALFNAGRVTTDTAKWSAIGSIGASLPMGTTFGVGDYRGVAWGTATAVKIGSNAYITAQDPANPGKYIQTPIATGVTGALRIDPSTGDLVSSDPATGAGMTVKKSEANGNYLNPTLQPGSQDWATQYGNTKLINDGSTLRMTSDAPGAPVTLPQAAGGEVVAVNTNPNNVLGEYVSVKDRYGRVHTFSHLSSTSDGHGGTIQKGDIVAGGSQIGIMGNSGTLTKSLGLDGKGYLDYTIKAPSSQQIVLDVAPGDPNDPSTECGAYARLGGDYANGAPMGDSLAEKKAWVKKYGYTTTNGIQQEDVVITNGSDVSKTGSPTANGHAFVVAGFEKGTNNIIAFEANADGNHTIQYGRKISLDNAAIQGYVHGNMDPNKAMLMEAARQKYENETNPGSQSVSTPHQTTYDYILQTKHTAAEQEAALKSLAKDGGVPLSALESGFAAYKAKAIAAGTYTDLEAEQKKAAIARAQETTRMTRIREASALVAPAIKSDPVFQQFNNATLYVNRLDSAINYPGSISDADLVDTVTKLNTGGNVVTESQVNLLKNYGSLADKAEVLGKQLDAGGFLSDTQRAELVDMAKKTYEAYKNTYQQHIGILQGKLTKAGFTANEIPITDMTDLTYLNYLSNPSSIPSTTNAPADTPYIDASNQQTYTDQQIEDAFNSNVDSSAPDPNF